MPCTGEVRRTANNIRHWINLDIVILLWHLATCNHWDDGINSYVILLVDKNMS